MQGNQISLRVYGVFIGWFGKAMHTTETTIIVISIQEAFITSVIEFQGMEGGIGGKLRLQNI